MKKRFLLPCVITAVILLPALLGGCSIQKLAINKVADMMSGEMGMSTYQSDADIQLVGDSLPFGLKLYETLLESAPEHEGLLLTAGMGFISYAQVYVQMPADRMMMEDSRKAKEMRTRAKNLYLRGRDYIGRALEIRHPGFLEAMESEGTEAVQQLLDLESSAEDIPFYYWYTTGWFAAVSTDMMDASLTLGIPKILVLMEKAYQLEPDWNNGLIHEFYISYYASVPEGVIENSEEKARYHFERENEIWGGTSPMPYVSLATTLCIKRQYAREFMDLLETALAMDVNANPENRLMAAVALDKGRWYLAHMEDFFLVTPEELSEYGEPE